MPDAGFVLEMAAIVKEFPGVRALRGVDLRVRKGEIHALLGENGAGKSTLMKVLCGYYPRGAFSGRIVLDGTERSFASPHDALTAGIGYVPQEISILDALTVAENIYVGQWNGEGRALVSPGALAERAAALLGRCGIALDPRTIAGHLNASQRQLVMIARALAREPSLLILDEATACLTLDEADNLFRIVRRMRDQGCTCLYITHKLSEVVEMADRATVLRDGACVAEFARESGPTGFSLNAIITAMVGRNIEQLFPPRRPFTGGEEALRITGLTIPHPRLAGRNLVEQVSLRVHWGEVLGLGGLVGAGRSEVLRAIYGLLPCTGDIHLAGRLVRIRSSAEAMRYGLGLLTEDRKRDGLLFNFAIRENTTLHALLRFQRAGLIDRRAESACAEDFRVRLGIRANDIGVMVNTLSGGNQQKVVLAKMLLPGPRVLLLDEPTKGVDVGAKTEIYAIINALAEQGHAVVLVSSDLPEILNLCDRHVVLARGRVSDEFTRSEADENRFMRAAVDLQAGSRSG